MNPGKAQAHSGHAANAFIFKHYISNDYDENLRSLVDLWMKSTPQGFGTQFNLKADEWGDVEDAFHVLIHLGYAAEIITDPTYPYMVTDEVFDLLPSEYTQGAIKAGDAGWICFREEQTAFYVFGKRSDPVLQEQLAKFYRHP
jgi:hypothetical protein